jgi:hypothetical protein
LLSLTYSSPSFLLQIFETEKSNLHIDLIEMQLKLHRLAFSLLKCNDWSKAYQKSILKTFLSEWMIKECSFFVELTHSMSTDLDVQFSEERRKEYPTLFQYFYVFSSFLSVTDDIEEEWVSTEEKALIHAVRKSMKNKFSKVIFFDFL